MFTRWNAMTWRDYNETSENILKKKKMNLLLLKKASRYYNIK